MGWYIGDINGPVEHATLLELADLALTHGNGRTALRGGCADHTLTRWYGRERELAAMLPEITDLALTHGN